MFKYGVRTEAEGCLPDPGTSPVLNSSCGLGLCSWVIGPLCYYFFFLYNAGTRTIEAPSDFDKGLWQGQKCVRKTFTFLTGRVWGWRCSEEIMLPLAMFRKCHNSFQQWWSSINKINRYFGPRGSLCCLYLLSLSEMVERRQWAQVSWDQCFKRAVQFLTVTVKS